MAGAPTHFNPSLIFLGSHLDQVADPMIEASKPFKKLTNEIFWNMAHWLGRKYKISMPEVMQRYVEGSTVKTKSTTLIMPSEYKAKKFMAKTWHNPYTAKEEIETDIEQVCEVEKPFILL